MMIMLLLAVVRMGGAARGLEHGWLDSASKRQQAQAQALSSQRSAAAGTGAVELPGEQRKRQERGGSRYGWLYAGDTNAEAVD